MANTTVQSEQIQDGSITADKLADGTIVAAELADNAVVTAAINADAVTGAKIADNAINSEHYTDGSIDTAHIADSQITVGKMAANSVDSDQYVDGSIDTVHIADLQVTTAKIANGNISTAKIADNAVTSAKIDTNIDIAGTFDVTGATTLDSTLAVAGVTTITTADNSDNLTLTSTDADANSGPNLRLYRNSSSPADGDNIGQLDWEGRNDNSQDVVYASMLARVRDNTDGTEDGGIQLDIMKDGSLTGLWKYYSNGTTSEFSINDDSIDMDFRVESNGNANMLFVDGGNDRVGIGTTSPSQILEVYNAATDNQAYLVLKNNRARNAAVNFVTTAANWYVGAGIGTDTDVFQIYDGDVGTRLLIDSSGNVGIGTTSPAAKLSVHGNVQFRTTNTDGNEERINWNVGGASDAPSQTMYGANGATAHVLLHAGGNSYFTGGNLGVGDNSPAYRLELPNTASSAGQVRANAYQTYSDSRIKTNIQTLSYGLDIVKQLKPSQYKHHNSIKEDGQFVKQDEGANDIGFIAQEVLPLIPEVVSVPEDVDKDLYSISYPKLTAVLTKAIQEQQTIIEAQTTSINDLKTRIEALES